MAEPTLDLNRIDFSSSGPDQHPSRNVGQNRYFAVSVASSADSSRASSPAPFAREKYSYTLNGEGIDIPGRQIDAYDTTLSWWRAAIRRKLVKSVQWESEVLAKMQVSQLFAMIFRSVACTCTQLPDRTMTNVTSVQLR
jgi:hypothetical protein